MYPRTLQNEGSAPTIGRKTSPGNNNNEPKNPEVQDVRAGVEKGSKEALLRRLPVGEVRGCVRFDMVPYFSLALVGVMP